MKSLVVVLMLGILSFMDLAFAAVPPRGKPSTGLVVVIDPGHGGTDPGAIGDFQGQTVVEDEYVYDVAKRVEISVRKWGAKVFLTIREPVAPADRPRNWPAQQVFPDERTEVFSLDGTLAVAGRGLRKRVAFANQILRRFPKHRVVFISLHFDALGNGEHEGVRIIHPIGAPHIVQFLERSFGSRGRLRPSFPVVESPDPNHGIRRLYVLSSRNKIKERVLIELGNFSNVRDVWRIRSFEVRQKFAEAIVEALRHFVIAS